MPQTCKAGSGYLRRKQQRAFESLWWVIIELSFRSLTLGREAPALADPNLRFPGSSWTTSSSRVRSVWSCFGWGFFGVFFMGWGGRKSVGGCGLLFICLLCFPKRLMTFPAMVTSTCQVTKLKAVPVQRQSVGKHTTEHVTWIAVAGSSCDDNQLVATHHASLSHTSCMSQHMTQGH